jgi:hypothetical protein
MRHGSYQDKSQLLRMVYCYVNIDFHSSCIMGFYMNLIPFLLIY